MCLFLSHPTVSSYLLPLSLLISSHRLFLSPPTVSSYLLPLSLLISSHCLFLFPPTVSSYLLPLSLLISSHCLFLSPPTLTNSSQAPPIEKRRSVSNTLPPRILIEVCNYCFCSTDFLPKLILTTESSVKEEKNYRRFINIVSLESSNIGGDGGGGF